MPETDRWASWLADRRFGGDQATRDRAFAEVLHPLRARVLAAAEPLSGARVLDVGSGDGLIGFGAPAPQACSTGATSSVRRRTTSARSPRGASTRSPSGRC